MQMAAQSESMKDMTATQVISGGDYAAQQLRLECLQLAGRHDADPASIVKSAELFYSFVLHGVTNPPLMKAA